MISYRALRSAATALFLAASAPVIAEERVVEPVFALQLIKIFARQCPYTEPRVDCERALVNIIASSAYGSLEQLSQLRDEASHDAVSAIVHRWRESEGRGVHVLD